MAPGLTAAALLLLLAPCSVTALERPSRQDLDRYRRDGTLQARVQQAYAIGNHRVRPDVAMHAASRLQLERSRGGLTTAQPEPPPAWKGMPTKGNVRTLALLIAFSDYAPTNSAASIDGKLFGDGDGGYPYESLRNFYRRSSYGQLALQGATLGWYTTSYPRSRVPMTAAGREALIKEALDSIDVAGHDFSQYDNDGDGTIDYFTVIWTGPDTGWAQFWWAFELRFTDSSYRLDGKSLGDYSWEWESRPGGGTFSPQYVIHETGHALGLPDYYDYDWGLGPTGGLGGIDMMDSATGDHNCFSKFLLDWISPTIASGGATPVALGPSGTSPGAVLFTRGATAEAFSEYFMLQNRTRGANDVDLPGDGFLVWHVDARLNTTGTDFMYDNSYTAHKLLRLMEADGLEEIERTDDYGYADAGDYYVAPRTFTHWTRPGTALYDGRPSFMQVVDISAAGDPMTARVEEIFDGTSPTGSPTTPADAGDETELDGVVFTWTAGDARDPDTGIAAYQLQVGTTPGSADVFDGPVGNVLRWTVADVQADRTYYARVRALDGAGLASAWSGTSDGITVRWPAFSCAALDNCSLTFKASGDALWQEESSFVHYGPTAARSGDVGDGHTSSLRTSVTGPGRLSFAWALSSPDGGGNLAVYVDRTLTLACGEAVPGAAEWAPVTILVPPGMHAVRWAFSSSGTAGASAGWVDRVEWTSDVSQGGIAGRVRDADTGLGIPGIAVYFYTSSPFTLADWSLTDASGGYWSHELPTGTYHARTANALGYVDQLFADRTCSGGYCSPGSGTPISVTPGGTAGGVDFALVRGGRVAGVVSDAYSGVPRPGSSVYLYDAAGRTVAAVSTDRAGGYLTDALPPGSFYAKARASDSIDELYDDVPCPGLGCSLTEGTPITVVPGAVTSGIDFAMTAYARIVGRITAVPTNAPIRSVFVDVYDGTGAKVAHTYTDSSGFYLTRPLPAGSYFAVTSNRDGYLDELFDDVPCPVGSCSYSTGTPIVVVDGARTTQIDFGLARPPGTDLYTVAPCRALDSRLPGGAFGGLPLVADEERELTLAGRCDIPVSAKAVALNLTITAATTGGHVLLYPGGTSRPQTSTVNFRAGETRGNNAVVGLGPAGEMLLHFHQATESGGTVHVIIDVAGYFE